MINDWKMVACPWVKVQDLSHGASIGWLEHKAVGKGEISGLHLGGHHAKMPASVAMGLLGSRLRLGLTAGFVSHQMAQNNTPALQYMSLLETNRGSAARYPRPTLSRRNEMDGQSYVMALSNTPVRGRCCVPASTTPRTNHPWYARRAIYRQRLSAQHAGLNGHQATGVPAAWFH
jgi:hypothetical protein